MLALSGTAVAAGIVPLAKRALTADKAKTALVAANAKKLGGQTAAQIAALSGPASSVAGLVSIKTAPFSIAVGSGGQFAAACAAGEKAIGGGYTTQAGVPLIVESTQTSNGGGWQLTLVNLDDTDTATGTVEAVCVK